MENENVQASWGTYMGHRYTPVGTKEFWGMADTELPSGTKLYAAPLEASYLLEACMEALECLDDGDIKNAKRLLAEAIAKTNNQIHLRP